MRGEIRYRFPAGAGNGFLLAAGFLYLFSVALSLPALEYSRGLLAEGTRWENPYYVIESGVDGPVVLITGGMHGNEPAGSRAAEQIVHWKITRGRVVIAPRTNTPGLKANTRFMPGVDKPANNLNRNFPATGAPDQARSVPGKALWELARKVKPGWVFDLHEGFDFNIANKGSVGSSVIYLDSPGTRKVATLLIDEVNSTITDPKRKFVHISGGPVNTGLARACIDRLGSKGFILETTFNRQPLSLRVRQHRLMVYKALSRLGMVEGGPHILADRKAAAAARGIPPGELVLAALYDGGGTGGNGVANVTRQLHPLSKVVLCNIGPSDIADGVLGQFDVSIFPGGSGSGIARAIGKEGRVHVQQFVRGGGGYLGICAGGYLAAANYQWSLGIVDARTITGKHWLRGRGKVKIELTEEGRRVFGDFKLPLDVTFANGPIVSPAGLDQLPDFEPLAIYRTEHAENGSPAGLQVGTPAIVAGRCGSGRVISISPHPEATAGLEFFIPRAVEWVADRSPESLVATPAPKKPLRLSRERIGKMPDLTATNPVAQLPFGGKHFSAPVAASNALAWLALERKYSRLLPPGKLGPQLQGRLASRLGSRGYMDTEVNRQTGTPATLKGLSRLIGEKGYSAKYAYQGWRRVEKKFKAGWPWPDLDWVRSSLQGDSLVLLNVGWYRHDAEKDVYQRFGGHWVSLAGYGVDEEGKADPGILLVHDSSPRAGMEPAVEYVRVTPISSGRLRGVSDMPKGANSAVGFFRLGEGMHINSERGDTCILDGVIVVRLQAP
ncbi:MAG: BPL-N domain-containing protein [Planctomycetota bacterium]